MSNTMWIQTDSLKSKNSTFPKYYTIYQFFVLHASYVIPNFVTNDFFFIKGIQNVRFGKANFILRYFQTLFCDSSLMEPS